MSDLMRGYMFSVIIQDTAGLPIEDIVQIAAKFLLPDKRQQILAALSSNQLPVVIAERLGETTTMKLCEALTNAGVIVDFHG